MKYLLYALCAAVMLTACERQEAGESNRSNELQFRAYIEEGGEIRPMSARESRTIAGNLAAGYRLSALLTTGDYPMAAHTRLMWNVGLNRDGSYQSATEKKYFWAAGDPTLRHSFVAYSANPAGTAAGEGADPATLAVGSDGRVTVDYSNPHDPAKQMDLLYSENVRNVKVSSSAPIVDLVFKHRLARVMVKMMGTGGVPLTDCQAKVSYKAGTVKNTAVITLADTHAIAFKNTTHWEGGIYNLGSSFSLPGSATTSATAVEVGDLILLPGQSLAADWATLTLTYTPDGGVTPQTVKTGLPAISLTGGKQFEILVNVIVDATTLSISGVTLTDWNSQSGNIDLEGVQTTPIPPTASEYFTFMGLKWAKGNLIGENSANCRVGKPSDHGLYFKFGSLVGWTGGTTGDGTGVSTNGSTAAIYAKPGSYSGAIGWSGVSYYGASASAPIPATDNEGTGIGDPCRFYLGDEWRTPTQEEFESLTYSAWSANSGANGAWGGLVTAGWSDANSVFFSAAGNRDLGDGNQREANTHGGYLAATYHSNTNNKALYIIPSQTDPSNNYNRSRAHPVRCVSGTYVAPITFIDYTATPANSYATYPTNGIMQGVKFNALKKPVAKYQKGSSSIANTTGTNPSTAAADASLRNNITYQAGDKIEVSWQTAVNHANAGTMVIKSITLGADGVATVEVNGAGNAVLSYKRGATILWNYHIWATDSNPFTTHYATGSNVNGTGPSGQARFMDRNLGALSATAAKPSPADAYKYFGVLYQHGRPSPFSGQGTGQTVNTYTAIYNGAATKLSSGSIGGYTQSTTAVSSVTSAVQTPNTYYYLNVPGWSWYNFADISLWSDYGTNKSIYDPCPYGYRVPINGSWSSWTNPHTQTWTNGDINGGVVNNSWWPAAGYRNYNSGALVNVGNYAYYQSSTRYSSAYRSYYLYFDYDGYVGPSNNGHRSLGFPVRCVEEGY